MEKTALKEYIAAQFPEHKTDETTQFVTLTIAENFVREVFTKLKEDTSLSFDYMSCLSGVDNKDGFMVVYHLESTTHRHILVLRAIIIGRENPSIDTVSDLYRTADFHEREVFEMFGVKFRNHPDLRKLLLPDDWVGYPMRKDYVDEVNIIEL